jgi:hypothetical protein
LVPHVLHVPLTIFLPLDDVDFVQPVIVCFFLHLTQYAVSQPPDEGVVFLGGIIYL